MEFNSSNEKQGILIEEIGDHNIVLVSFGGIKQGLGMPVFEFLRILESFKCDKIFLRDFMQMWYHKGVDTNIDNLDKLLENLRKIVSQYNKTVFLGNSMGGYSAILFGLLLDVDQVVSFSPQTFIDRKNRLLFRDKRWKIQIRKTQKANLYPEYFDLKKLFRNITDYRTKFHIYYSSLSRLDRIHSQRLRKYKGINLHEYSNGGHNLVKDLKNTGELLEVLKMVFNE